MSARSANSRPGRRRSVRPRRPDLGRPAAARTSAPGAAGSTAATPGEAADTAAARHEDGRQDAPRNGAAAPAGPAAPTRGPGPSRAELLGGPHSTLDWARAVLAGIEGVLAPWLLVIIGALVAYIATADAPALGEAGWQEAVRIGTGVFLLGSGGHLGLGQDAMRTVLTLAPLGMSALTLLSVRIAVRRQAVTDLPTAGVTILAVVVTSLLLGLLPPGPVGWPSLALGALLLGLLGVAWARPHLLVRERWPALVRDSVAGAGRALACLGVIGLGLLVAAGVLGRDEIASLYDGVTNDGIGVVLLTLVQLLLVPNLIVWAISFAAGPGFAVGAGTEFTSTGVVSAPLPALPVLGALPHPGDPGYGWLIGLVIGVGVLVGIWLHARRRAATPGAAALTASGTGLATGIALALLGLAASGAIGPDRLAVVGVEPLLLGLAAFLEIGVPAVVLTALLHPGTRRWARSLRGRGAVDGAGSGDDEAGRDDESGEDGNGVLNEEPHADARDAGDTAAEGAAEGQAEEGRGTDDEADGEAPDDTRNDAPESDGRP